MLQILVDGSSLTNSKMDSMEPSVVEGEKTEYRGPTSQFLNEISGISYIWLDQPVLQSFAAIGSHTVVCEIQKLQLRHKRDSNQLLPPRLAAFRTNIFPSSASYSRAAYNVEAYNMWQYSWVMVLLLHEHCKNYYLACKFLGLLAQL